MKPGFFSNWRNANFKSFMVGCQWSVVRCQLLLISGSVRRFRGSSHSEFGFWVFLRISFVIWNSYFVMHT